MYLGVMCNVYYKLFGYYSYLLGDVYETDLFMVNYYDS